MLNIKPFKGSFLCTLLLFFSVTIYSQDIAAGLKAYYNFNDNEVIDLSETGLDGTPLDLSPSIGIEEVSNSAYLFNGTSSSVLCEEDNRNVTDQVSLSAWIKTVSDQRQFILGKYNSAQDRGYFLATLNGTATIGGRDGSNEFYEIFDNEVLINDGEWHHVVGIINQNTWTLYIDCIEVASTTTNTTTPDFQNTDPLAIGLWVEGTADGNKRYFNGEIDEVRLYNRALLETEISILCDQDNYVESTPNLTLGLKAYFDFNQETILDLSETAIDGTGAEINPTTGIEDTINSAFLFNGSSSNILCEDDNRSVTDRISLSAWVKTESDQRQFIIGKYNSAQDKGYFLATLNGTATLGGRDGSNEFHEILDSEILITDGKWHQVVGIIDKNKWTLYIDCVEVASKTTTTVTPDFQNTDPLTIGFWFEGTAEGNKRYFDGTIDEVRLYNRPLQMAEINFLCNRDNYIAPSSSPSFGLKAYFNFNQESILDLSETAIDGTGFDITPATGIEDTINSAYLFNGTSSRILCEEDNRGVTDRVSLSAWVKTQSNERQFIIGKYNSAQDKGYFLATLNGTATIGGRDGSNEFHEIFDNEVLITDGEWHLIVGIIDKNEWTLYIDCVEVASKTTNTPAPDFQNTDPLTIGFWFEGTAEGNKRYFDGIIDEVRLYNVAIDPNIVNLLCDDGNLMVSNEPILSLPANVKIFPNPVRDLLFIKGEADFLAHKAGFEIIDILGRPVKRGILINQEINVSKLEHGTYFLLLRDTVDRKIYQITFIKK